MRKVFGYLLSWLLIATGLALVFPVLLGALCFWAVINLRCWSARKHTYDPQQILNGLTVKSMRCTKCYKLISSEEEAGVQAQIDVYIASLRQSREFLNDVFNTPSENAVEQIIEETRGNN